MHSPRVLTVWPGIFALVREGALSPCAPVIGRGVESLRDVHQPAGRVNAAAARMSLAGRRAAGPAAVAGHPTWRPASAVMSRNVGRRRVAGLPGGRLALRAPADYELGKPARRALRR
jgi:hypothetical protein